MNDDHLAAGLVGIHDTECLAEVAYQIETTEPAVRRHAIAALNGARQPNPLIQPAMACPIASGESSWR